LIFSNAHHQVIAELAAFVCQHYNLPPQSFSLAVCGLRVKSEHEDECCVVMELLEPFWQLGASADDASDPLWETI
jgi:hypothetical protein